MPGEQEWYYWAVFKDLYGAVSSVEVLGTRLIILNSYEACRDLLERQSALYSGRPSFHFAGKMVGWHKQLILSPYGERFRIMRKMLRQYIGGHDEVARFAITQESGAKHFLGCLDKDPSNLLAHIRALTSTILLDISHGYTVQQEGRDPFVYLNETAAKEFFVATKPGWLVDTFPFLEYFPGWFPGFGFHKLACQFRTTLENGNVLPFRFVEEQMNRGVAKPSFTTAYLEDGAAIEIGQCAAGAIYAGGTDTVAATLYTFYLAMALFPHVQHTAQQEIDNLVGRERLPALADMARLPYLNALFKEVMRWHTIGPMGIPHCADIGGSYNGHQIPKGSLLLTNLWQIAHDPANYTDPMSFDPTRFLSKMPELDPRLYIFGFGRRRCPGLVLAESIVLVTMATSLAAFNVTQIRGEPIRPKFTSGTISYPEAFRCNFDARFPGAEELFRETK